MKALSKPISSPGRTEKFPTPLMMRFLRSNVGSRSRGRSRSSPMFILRTKKNAAAPMNEAQQEPSSPKVTCIGQVRVRRSSKASSGGAAKSKSKRPSTTTPSQHCCCSCSYSCCVFPRAHFCQHFTSRFHKPRSFCATFRKWASFFRFGYCKKVDTRDESSRFESIRSQNNHVGIISHVSSHFEENEGNVKEPQVVGETKEAFLQYSSSPPKNALLLTRCRSAPYRSSSLASRFWGSPLESSETETLKNELEEQGGVGVEIEKPISPNFANESVESRNSSSHGGSEELDNSSSNGGNTNKEVSIQDLRAIGGRESIHPLLLTRCKSEPAKTGERLNPEPNFWRQRRSDTAESCLQPSNCD